MSRYKFILNDYHAIKNADITLNGITVLAGVNGSGKSTLSRWLYYIVNGSANYERNLIKNYVESMMAWVTRVQFAFQDIDQFLRMQHGASVNFTEKLYKYIWQMNNLKNYSLLQVDEIKSLFLQVLHFIGDVIMHDLVNTLPKIRLNRIFMYLQIESGTDNIQKSITDFIEVNTRWVERKTDKLYINLSKRPMDLFNQYVKRYFGEEGEMPKNLQLKEDGVDILEPDHIANIFNLRESIYIDTPMSITVRDSKNPFWYALRKLILVDKNADSPEVKKILLRIKKLLKGEAVLDDETEFSEDRILRYVSSDNKINIDLNETATGFKTFSYLQRLLGNGSLTENTLLLIDEPEAHLHPQWIVEFAHLLVLLHKNIGVKIMLASHNPDMVAAIQAIANKEGVLDNTNFYVSKPSEDNPNQFVYKDLGHEIGEIFESFNIALDRINQYGSTDI